MNILHKVYELKLWKRKLFCVTSVIFLIPILFCIIRIAAPGRVWEYVGEGGYRFTEADSGTDVVVWDGISLTPGVYRIELAYDTDLDAAALCNVADGTVFYKGLCSNGEHMYSGLHRTGFHIWLYESTENLQVVVSYGGKGNLVTGDLRVVETKQLWTMLLTIMAFGWSMASAAQIFLYYDKCYSIDVGKKQAFFWVAAISFIASVPYLCGYTITGADLTYHLQRIEGVKDGLLGGQFPVRLEPKWMYGHGYADAIFYCNTLLYVPALLRLLGFPIWFSYNVYCIVINIATAGISYYCFGKMSGSRHIGAVSSALYTLSIIRIYKLLIETSVGEGTAMTFIPLVLYGLYGILTQDPEKKEYKRVGVPLMVGFSGLIQSHVLTCEITAAVVLLFCIIFVRKIWYPKVFLALLKGAAVTMCVCLWFLVPFLDYFFSQNVHVRNVSGRTIQERGLYPAHLPFQFWRTDVNLFYRENGMQYSVALGVGLVLCVGLGVFLILWFSGKFRKSEERDIAFVKAASVMGILMMYMSLNLFPWDRIQALHPIAASLVSSLQFPYRSLGWGTACLVLVFGYCMRYFRRQSGGKYCLVLGGAAIFGVMTSGMYLLDFVNGNQSYYELYNEESMGSGYISGAEYLMEGTDESQVTYRDATAGPGVEIREYRKASLEVTLWCSNEWETESYIDFPMLLYKGYKAVCTDTGEEMPVCPGENNVVRVLIPKGFEGEMMVRFVSPVYWRVSELISLLTMASLAVMWWNMRNERRKMDAKREMG